MILVTFALPDEGYSLQKRLANRRKEDGVVLGEIEGKAVGLLWLGIGALHQNRLREAIRRYRPSLVLSSGFAGAVRSLLVPGDFLWAENYSSSELYDQIGHLFEGAGSFFCTREVAGKAFKKKLGFGPSNPSSIACPKVPWVAIDMESDAVSNVCREENVRLAVARMISDTVTEEIPSIFVSGRFEGLGDLAWILRFSIRMLRLRTVLAQRLINLVKVLA